MHSSPYAANPRLLYLTIHSASGFTVGHPAGAQRARPKPRLLLRFAAALASILLLAAVTAQPSAGAASPPAPAAAAGEPTAFVKSVVDQASAVVRDTSIPVAERNRKLRSIAEANFDFTDMARTALGYHWRELTPEQRAQFVPLFTSFMEAVYLNKMQDYGVEKIRKDIGTTNVTFTGQDLQGADYAEVHSTAVFQDRSQPVKVDYLLKRAARGWKIYDLDIDAISVMANYRNQFNRVINDQGYPALVATLKKKTQALDQTLNK
jgi:phospholipid transport system substrate-binding protein